MSRVDACARKHFSRVHWILVVYIILYIKNVLKLWMHLELSYMLCLPKQFGIFYYLFGKLVSLDSFVSSAFDCLFFLNLLSNFGNLIFDNPS
jgi:hypothetical protein